VARAAEHDDLLDGPRRHAADTGTIYYVRGSNAWPRAPLGGTFHAPDDWLAHVRDSMPAGAELDLVPIEVPAGGAAFHDGWTFHGSPPNERPTPSAARSSRTWSRPRRAGATDARIRSTPATAGPVSASSTTRSSRHVAGGRPAVGMARRLVPSGAGRRPGPRAIEVG
jgi:hypothetical protein